MMLYWFYWEFKTLISFYDLIYHTISNEIRYRVIEVLAGGASAMVEWRLETGRTHQVLQCSVILACQWNFCFLLNIIN